MIPDPARVLIAGDWHGNLPWAKAVVGEAVRLLPDEPVRTIVHVGDFGVWPGTAGERFLAELGDLLHGARARVLFVDGNHEDHAKLLRLRDTITAPGRRTDRVSIGRSITYLPRGHRWTWHGRTWLACGGATSVDRTFRREGIDWWPEEAISEADHHRITDGGRADVMVCHDAPSTVHMDLGPWPRAWDLADKARADAHRERLQAIVDEVRPSWLLHGHYHRWHDQLVSMDHAVVRVLGLDCDEALSGNYRVLDVRDMTLAEGHP